MIVLQVSSKIHIHNDSFYLHVWKKSKFNTVILLYTVKLVSVFL